MRQLYHLGVIEAFSGVTKKKEGEAVRGTLFWDLCLQLVTKLTDCFCVQLEACDVTVSPDLQQQLCSVVQELGVQIPPPVSLLRPNSE